MNFYSGIVYQILNRLILAKAKGQNDQKEGRIILLSSLLVGLFMGQNLVSCSLFYVEREINDEENNSLKSCT